MIAADALLVNGVGVQGGLRYGLLGAFELIAGGAIVLLAMKIAGMSPKAAGFTLEKAGSDVAIGLGIGAMYVRSMTIMLVEKQTLSHLPYLEHGAFYSIIALAVIMFAQSLVHVPEVITGLLGAAIIGLSLWSSLRYNRRAAAAV